MTADPLELLDEDRAKARQANDPLVNRCVLGTVDRNGQVALRTLVLREIDDRLALFYNRTSSKHIELMNDGYRGSLLIFLPSIGVQYRIKSRFEEISESVMERHWQLKPDAAKRMDSIYQVYPQSSRINNRYEFEGIFSITIPPREAPRNGIGVFVVPESIERLELRTDPQMHDRKVFVLEDDDWYVHRLVP